VTPTGTEQIAFSSENSSGQAADGAVLVQLAADPALESVIDAWPRLSPELRAAIGRMVEPL
jgi:hypothetical protein